MQRVKKGWTASEEALPTARRQSGASADRGPNTKGDRTRGQPKNRAFQARQTCVPQPKPKRAAWHERKIFFFCFVFKSNLKGRRAIGFSSLFSSTFFVKWNGRTIRRRGIILIKIQNKTKRVKPDTENFDDDLIKCLTRPGNCTKAYRKTEKKETSEIRCATQ